MAIAAPISGAYTGTYNYDPLGYTKQGYNLNFTQKGERFEESDLYGMSLLDVVGRGAQMTIDATFRVWSSTIIAAQWPWAGAFGRVYNENNPIGNLASLLVNFIVLTVVANTPAVGSPTSLTAGVILSPDQASQINFNSTIRDTPLRFDVLLQDNEGLGTLFIST